MLAFVLGTNTEVGKTSFSVALLRLARAMGVDAVGLKPAQTGEDSPSDAARLSLAAGVEQAPLYRYPEPISPHLAARARGVRIDVGAILSWVESRRRALTLVETAGGAFSPLNEQETNADLVSRGEAGSRVFLVCSSQLGTFHAVTATLRALGPLASRTQVVVSAPTKLKSGLAVAAELARLETAGLHTPALVLGPGEQLEAESERRLRAWLAPLVVAAGT